MSVFKFGMTALVLAVALSGCTAIKDWAGKRDNGSLDYRTSKKLAPIQLPANQPSADFISLYPTPNLTQAETGFTNDASKQFELPKPPAVK